MIPISPQEHVLTRRASFESNKLASTPMFEGHIRDRDSVLAPKS